MVRHSPSKDNIERLERLRSLADLLENDICDFLEKHKSEVPLDNLPTLVLGFKKSTT